MSGIDEIKDLFQTYSIELLAFLFIAVYSLNFWVGRSKNNGLAVSSLRKINSILKEQFSEIGSYNPPRDDSLIKESNSRYLLYCSGRRNCNGLLVTINLQRRHDLFYVLMRYFKFSLEQDSITIEISMSSSDYKEPLLFCVVERAQENELLESMEDVKNHTNVYKCSKIPSDFHLRMEVPEMEGLVLDTLVAKTIQEHSKHISYIHISDLAEQDKELGNRLLRFQIKIDESLDNSEALSRLTLMSCYLVDLISGLKLHAQTKKIIESKRLRVKEALFKASHKEREEASQRLKEEKLQKELESRQGLSKAAIMKREEKLRRRQMKKNGGKTMVCFV